MPEDWRDRPGPDPDGDVELTDEEFDSFLRAAKGRPSVGEEEGEAAAALAVLTAGLAEQGHDEHPDVDAEYLIEWLALKGWRLARVVT